MKHAFPVVVVVVTAFLSACSAGRSGDPDGGAEGEGSGDALTWYGDVEPIVQRSCLGCHVEGGIGPFSLEEYEIAEAYAPLIASHVAARTMPPWMPSDECEPLRDSRRLSDEEVATLTTWVEQGAHEGDAADHVEPETRPGMARVDLELEMSAGYVPNQDLDDDYRCFILDPGLEADRFITGIDILPGNRSLVHHVLLFPADAANAAALDDGEPGNGWTCFGGPGTDSLVALGAWAPGTPPVTYPEGTGVRLEAGQVIVMQIHYHLDNGPAAPDRTKVQLRLEPSVDDVATLFPLFHDGFEIPPASEGYTDGLSVDIGLLGQVAPNARLHGVLPHMHTLGRQIRFAVEGAEERCLVDVPSWDFHWQQAYFFEEEGGVGLAGGGQLVLECTWDNPTSSTVRWGEGTNDEMCLVYLYVTGVPEALFDFL